MKKTANLILATALTAFFLFCSCERENSEDVNQDRIYTDFELFYNANHDITYARAVFRFGNALGTLLQLSEPSEVKFNDEILSFKPALAYYEKQFTGFVDSGSFEWKDTEGKIFVNSISVNTIDYPGDMDTISKSFAFELIWDGESLKENESVVIAMNGVIEGDAQIFTQNAVNSTSIILAKNQLEILGHGNATMWMDRTLGNILDQKTSAGGKISARYRPLNKTIYID